jgi:hypothetical protein
VRRGRDAPSSVASVIIRLILIRDDPRARALLADVVRRLELEAIEPDDRGDINLAFEPSPDHDPWERVRAALDAAGDDWWQYIHLPRHASPARGATAR